MTHTPRPHTRTPKGFLRSQSGAVTPLMGLMMLMLIGIMGLALDFGRAFLVHARLASALDSAGLAVGARLTTTDYSADAKKYVDANFQDGYSAAKVTKVTAVANADKTQISLTGHVDMPTSFMRLFGKDSVSVNAAAEVVRASPGLELALVLDNTGSMSGAMPALKKAATDLTNIVFGGQETQKNLYVGVVPFSQAINIGTQRSGWTKTNSSQDWGPSAWGGCVEERLLTLEMSDTAPAKNSQRFTRYYNPDSSANDWISGSGSKKTYDITSKKGPNYGCPQAMTGLSASKKTVTDSIDNMHAVGLTHVNVGAVWGWRMLSPNWKNYWGGEMDSNGLPLAYKTPRMSKAVVLMTDGDNTADSSAYTGYGLLTDLRLGSLLPWVAEAAMDTRLKTVCENMKTAGITIYTVAFNNPSGTTKTILQNCASNINFYFDATSSEKLMTSFKTIGDSLSNLRVSK